MKTLISPKKAKILRQLSKDVVKKYEPIFKKPKIDAKLDKKYGKKGTARRDEYDDSKVMKSLKIGKEKQRHERLVVRERRKKLKPKFEKLSTPQRELTLKELEEIVFITFSEVNKIFGVIFKTNISMMDAISKLKTEIEKLKLYNKNTSPNYSDSFLTTHEKVNKAINKKPTNKKQYDN